MRGLGFLCCILAVFVCSTLGKQILEEAKTVWQGEAPLMALPQDKKKLGVNSVSNSTKTTTSTPEQKTPCFFNPGSSHHRAQKVSASPTCALHENPKDSKFSLQIFLGIALCITITITCVAIAVEFYKCRNGLVVVRMSSAETQPINGTSPAIEQEGTEADNHDKDCLNGFESSLPRLIRITVIHDEHYKRSVILPPKMKPKNSIELTMNY